MDVRVWALSCVFESSVLGREGVVACLCCSWKPLQCPDEAITRQNLILEARSPVLAVLWEKTLWVSKPRLDCLQ